MRRLLVIDDHPAVMEGTKAILETNQDFVVDCLSPEASEQFLKKHDFSAYDLILMDLNLGEINGMGKSLRRVHHAKLSFTQAMKSKIILKRRFVPACTAPSAKRNRRKRL